MVYPYTNTTLVDYNILSLFFLFQSFILVQLIYSVVIISAIRKSDSVIRVHILILLQIFSHVDYHRVSNDFLRLFHTCKYMH